MKHRFADLADIAKLQELMGSLYWLTDIAIGIIEADGSFLFCAGWCASCCAGNAKSCDCHSYISAHLDPVAYTCKRCPTGMMHYACPIIVEEEHLASVYIGQFFTEPPDEAAVISEAAQRGIDPSEYRKALDKFSIVPPMRLALLLKYLKDLSNMLADIGLQRLQQMETLRILRLNEDRLQYLSSHDPLTGLQNRICFENGMTEMDTAAPLPAAVMVMDLDGLKRVNDSLGHSAGDALLRATAGILRDSAPSDSIVARIGGDEFAILLFHTDCDAADAIRRRILAKVEHHNVSNPSPELGISIGIAVAESTPFGMRDLFKIADANMYRDKACKAKKPKGSNDEHVR